MKDANDAAVALGEEFATKTRELTEKSYQKPPPGCFSLRDLRQRYLQPKEAIIEGLLRRCEVATLVAPPKCGKTWLAYHLVFSILSGRSFIREDWKCRPGKVLIFDNELHPETLSHRLTTVRSEMKLDPDIDDNLRVVPLRGNWMDIKGIKNTLKMNMEWGPSLIVFDALYRMYWEGFSENDNAHMSQLVNLLDQYADMMQAAIICIHHSAKGNHAEKEIHELGAGGGALGRAVDTCMGLRSHETQGQYVFEAELRTWKRVESCVMKWEHPSWAEVVGEDPTQLKGGKKVKQSRKEKPTEADYTAEALAGYMRDDWMPLSSVAAVLERERNFSRESARELVNRVQVQCGLIKMPEFMSKDCGAFEAKGCKNGGVLVKRKPRVE